MTDKELGIENNLDDGVTWAEVGFVTRSSIT